MLLLVLGFNLGIDCKTLRPFHCIILVFPSEFLSQIVMDLDVSMVLFLHMRWKRQD